MTQDEFLKVALATIQIDCRNVIKYIESLCGNIDYDKKDSVETWRKIAEKAEWATDGILRIKQDVINVLLDVELKRDEESD